MEWHEGMRSVPSSLPLAPSPLIPASRPLQSLHASRLERVLHGHRAAGGDALDLSAQTRRSGDRARSHGPVDRLQRLDARTAALRGRRLRDGGRPLRHDRACRGQCHSAGGEERVAIDGGELYTTASPCWNCFKLIANAGIRRIYYGEFYRDERSREVAKEIGIELIDLGMPAAAAS